MKYLHLTLFYIVLICLGFLACSDKNPQEITAISLSSCSFTEHKRSVISQYELNMLELGLVNVQSMCDNIHVDLKYSSTDNFLGIDLYGDLTKAYLQPEAADKLCEAQVLLDGQKLGYHLIVYDAARPNSVQQIMWDSLDVPLQIKHWYVANPQAGSIHNYGMAVDVSIVDSMGIALDMGTAFDFFGELAIPHKEDLFLTEGLLDSLQVVNRKLLIEVMSKAGFYVSKTEWWHYNAGSLAYAKAKYEIIK